MFKKYQHIEKFGNHEVEGIENGMCYIFYKIDGTNSSLWVENGELQAGSRNRHLSLDQDNAGFYKWALEQDNIISFLKENQNIRLFGEWLVPHSLKNYKDNAWRDFYVFDCVDCSDSYIPYDEYSEWLDVWNIKTIPPICKINNPTEESLYKLLDKTGDYLIKEGSGRGEGIVIKNYDFVNKYGRTVWAKIVCNEFKEKNQKSFGIPEIRTKSLIEEKIIFDLLSESFIEKEYQKIILESEWSSKYVPRLLNVVFYEFVKDEIWNIIKKYKNPKIDFGILRNQVILRIKQVKKELFL